jgi:hypothetical protein
MLGRVVAFAIAISIGATGVLPTGDGVRCVAMDKRMAPGQDCCPKCDPPPLTAIGTACCEVIHGQVLEARAPASQAQLRIAPAPLTAVLAPASVKLVVGGVALRSIAAQPRGRPPGELLDRFSAVLRV